MADTYWIDTHAHLYVDKFEADIDDVLARCRELGLRRIYLPNIDASTIASMDDLSDRYPDLLRPMHGLHPCSVDDDFMKLLNKIEPILASGRSYGVGETGIDLYWDVSHREAQIVSFQRHIEWSKTYELPIVIHSRNALDLTISNMAKHHDDRLSGVFHCFDGDLSQARQIMDMGAYMGIGGVVTYKKSHLPEVIREIGLSHIILETDSPYLPPVPHRGQRNESSYIPIIGAFIADVLDVSIAEVAERTTHNAMNLFKEHLQDTQ